MVKVSSVETLDEFKKLEGAWNGLLEQSSCSSIFLRWEWMFTWWEVYGRTRLLRILVAKENGNLVGVAPLFCARETVLGTIPFKKMYFLGGGAAGAVHLDFVVATGREQDVSPLLLEGYMEYSDWDRMELTDFREESPNIKIIRDFCEKNNLQLSLGVDHVCPYLRLPGSWEEYLASLSWRTRKHIRHDMRKMLDQMGAEYLEWKDYDTLEGPLNRLMELHQERWTSRGKLGSFGTDRFRAFHKALIGRVFPKDMVKISAIRYKGEIVAVYYSFVVQRKIYCYITGFDYRLNKHGPGTVLLASTIKKAIEEGMEEFDFLRGESDYKYKWTEARRKNITILISRNKWKHALAAFEERKKKALAAKAKSILPQSTYLRLQKVRTYLKLR